MELGLLSQRFMFTRHKLILFFQGSDWQIWYPLLPILSIGCINLMFNLIITLARRQGIFNQDFYLCLVD